MRVTSWCAVTIATASPSTATCSCFSCGSTSRNQPVHPLNARIAPKKLTPALVTSPAKISAHPSARTNGQAVDDGRFTLSRAAWLVCGADSIRSSLPSHQINHSEHHHPYGIHKMPIHREHFAAVRVLHVHSARQRKQQHNRERHQPHRHVRGVQSHKRVIGDRKSTRLNSSHIPLSRMPS